MFQEILTERLLLRCLVPDDAENMFQYRTNPEILQYQSWHPQSLDEVHSFINSMSTREFNSPGWYQIAIALRSDGSFIGDCGIHVLETDPRIVEIGITTAPIYQSNGYASEAFKAILKLLFVEFSKHRVVCSVDPRNLPSMALMQRIGMRKEGHSLQSLWFKEEWADDVQFAMLASEWNAIPLHENRAFQSPRKLFARK